MKKNYEAEDTDEDVGKDTRDKNDGPNKEKTACNIKPSANSLGRFSRKGPL